MSIVHTVIGNVLGYLFVTHFFDKPSEYWATRDQFGDVSPIRWIESSESSICDFPVISLFIAVHLNEFVAS